MKGETYRYASGVRSALATKVWHVWVVSTAIRRAETGFGVDRIRRRMREVGIH